MLLEVRLKTPQRDIVPAKVRSQSLAPEAVGNQILIMVRDSLITAIVLICFIPLIFGIVTLLQAGACILTPFDPQVRPTGTASDVSWHPPTIVECWKTTVPALAGGMWKITFGRF